MRLLHLYIFWGALIGLACATTRTDYTGLWKRSCSDDFGIQIKLTDSQLYSVSFCGPAGCFEPGEWTPNTRIDGDAKYKVISPTELGIQRSDGVGYFNYTRCETDPTWLLANPPDAESKDPLDCSIRKIPNEAGVLIAWTTDVRVTTQYGPGIEPETTTVESFRLIANLQGSSLEETAGAAIDVGQPFWPILRPTSDPLTVRSAGSFLDHLNEDHCVYFGTLGEEALPRWTLLSSKPLPGEFKAPTATDRAEFYRLNSSCVQQGDYAEEQQPPCVRPQLLAVSDIDKNGQPEYWATQPYLWDTGLTVWENRGTLVKLLQVCVGCSD